MSRNDQLKKILDVLGYQDKDSLSFLNDESAIKYHDTLVSADRPNILRKLFPYTSEGLLDLLEGMLTFNPQFRWTAAKCLKLKIFDKIRKKSCEEPSKRQVYLPLYDEGAYDYKNQTSIYTID